MNMPPQNESAPSNNPGCCLIVVFTVIAWLVDIAWGIGLSDGGGSREHPFLIQLLGWGMLGVPPIGMVAGIVFVTLRNRRKGK